MQRFNYILKGNPCTRDCPDRKPGCNCDKRKEYKKLYDERKAAIDKERYDSNLVYKVRFKN